MQVIADSAATMYACNSMLFIQAARYAADKQKLIFLLKLNLFTHSLGVSLVLI